MSAPSIVGKKNAVCRFTVCPAASAVACSLTLTNWQLSAELPDIQGKDAPKLLAKTPAESKSPQTPALEPQPPRDIQSWFRRYRGEIATAVALVALALLVVVYRESRSLGGLCNSNRKPLFSPINSYASIASQPSRNAQPDSSDHLSLVTAVSNHHTPRLENAISHRKQTLGTLSDRHFLQGSERHERRIADADRPRQVATHIVSNRRSQILEITKNPTKTHNSSVLIDTKTRFARPESASGHESQAAVQAFCVPQVFGDTNHRRLRIRQTNARILSCKKHQIRRHAP